MDKLIVKMPRSEGDVLVRMKNEYEDLSVQDSSFKTILAPKGEAELFKRLGTPYSVTEQSDVDDVVTALAISVVAASKIPTDAPIHDDAVVNQANATIAKVDAQNYTISADFSKLVKFESNNDAQAAYGECYWLALGVATGETTIVGITCDGATFTAQDVTDATYLGLPAGSFVLWVRLEAGTKRMLLENSGKSTVVNISVKNTEA